MEELRCKPTGGKSSLDTNTLVPALDQLFQVEWGVRRKKKKKKKTGMPQREPYLPAKSSLISLRVCVRLTTAISSSLPFEVKKKDVLFVPYQETADWGGVFSKPRHLPKQGKKRRPQTSVGRLAGSTAKQNSGVANEMKKKPKNSPRSM
jgi:hypothetical protein